MIYRVVLIHVDVVESGCTEGEYVRWSAGSIDWSIFVVGGDRHRRNGFCRARGCLQMTSITNAVLRALRVGVRGNCLTRRNYSELFVAPGILSTRLLQRCMQEQQTIAALLTLHLCWRCQKWMHTRQTRHLVTLQLSAAVLKGNMLNEVLVRSVDPPSSAWTVDVVNGLCRPRECRLFMMLFEICKSRPCGAIV